MRSSMGWLLLGGVSLACSPPQRNFRGSMGDGGDGGDGGALAGGGGANASHAGGASRSGAPGSLAGSGGVAGSDGSAAGSDGVAGSDGAAGSDGSAAGTGGGGTSGGGTGSGGKGGSGGTAGAGDTTAPTIVSISPTNNTTGVRSDAQIKITFSEVMSSSTVTQALQVGGFTANDLNTSWDAAGKVLTVTPKTAFAYATGSTPAGTSATRYTVTLGTGAKDLAGNALAGAFNSSFTTLRRITQSIASGVAAAYSTYGHAVGDGPQTCPANDPVWVEVWSSVASGGTYYVFIPFDTTVMGTASTITLESATFSATQVAPTPGFYLAHEVRLKRLKYQAIDKTVLDAAVLNDFGVFSSVNVPQPTANVFASLSADLTANVRQELFRLEPTGIADSLQANFTCSGFFLNVVYLRP
jgi:hypothetical protein